MRTEQEQAAPTDTELAQAVPETFPKKRELLVTRLRDGFISSRVDVTGRSERQVERILRGMLINADTNNWVIRDTDWDVPPPLEEMVDG